MPSDNNRPEDRGPWKNKQTRVPPEVDAILRRGRDRLHGILPDGLPPVKRLAIGAAIALARDNDIPIIVCSIWEEGNLAKVLEGEALCTTITSQASS